MSLQKEAIKKEKEEEEAEEAKKKEEEEKEQLAAAEDEASDAKKPKLEDDPNVYDPFLEEDGQAENANGNELGAVGLDELEDEIAQTDEIFEDVQGQQMEGFDFNQDEETEQTNDFEQPDAEMEQLLGESEEQPVEDMPEEDEEVKVATHTPRGRRGRRGGRGRAM